MISEANQVALAAAGLSYILGARIPHQPDVVREWRDKHPDDAVPDGLVLTQPWPATIVVGALLLILGFVFGIHLLWVLGIVLLVIGAVLWIMGPVGRPVAGRRYWY